MLFPKYEDIKTMYGWGCYTNEQIKWFVDMEVIDKEEYALITGEKYPEQPQAQACGFLFRWKQVNA